jgi:hypothetical protein
MEAGLDPLILDLVEWVSREPRLYSDVLDAWRTSCPRLTVWEDAVDRGYLTIHRDEKGMRVGLTPGGAKFLAEHGRAIRFLS